MSLSETVSVAEFFYTYVLQPQHHTYANMLSMKNPVIAQVSEPTSLSNAENGNEDFVSFATVNEVNQCIRRLLPPRGNRFRHDHHDTCMYIERSKNANVVAYTANLLNKQTQQRVESGASSGALCECVFDAKTPLRCYWIKLEPEHVARRRARGEMEDVCELSMIERKLAFGCSASTLPLHKLLHELTYLAKSKKNSHLTSYESNGVINTNGEFTKTLQNCSCTDLNEESVKSSNNNNNNNNSNRFFHRNEQETQHHHKEHISHHHHHSNNHHKSGHCSSREDNSYCNTNHYTSNNNSSFSRHSISIAASSTITNNEKRIAEWHASFQPCVVKFAAMPHRPLLLLLLPPLVSQQTCTSSDNDYVPVMISAHNGHIVLVTSIYVKSIEPKHFYQLPSVEFIDVKGYSLQTGEALAHREYAENFLYYQY